MPSSRRPLATFPVETIYGLFYSIAVALFHAQPSGMAETGLRRRAIFGDWPHHGALASSYR